MERYLDRICLVVAIVNIALLLLGAASRYTTQHPRESERWRPELSQDYGLAYDQTGTFGTLARFLAS
jgi:hypothetical protein